MDKGKEARIKFWITPPRGGSLVAIRDAVSDKPQDGPAKVDPLLTLAGLLEDIVLVHFRVDRKLLQMIEGISLDSGDFLGKVRAATKFVKFSKKHGGRLLEAMSKDRAHPWLRSTTKYLESCVGDI